MDRLGAAATAIYRVKTSESRPHHDRLQNR